MNESESKIDISWDRIGKAGVVVLTVLHPGGVFTEKLDITKSRERNRVLTELGESLPGIPLDTVREEIDEIASQAIPKPDESGAGDGQADLLVALTDKEDVELFHAPGAIDADAYATIKIENHRETWGVRSKGFKRWLLLGFYREHGHAPNEQAVSTALATIEAKASFDGDERLVEVRVAGGGGVVWIDLGDPTWSAVRVDRDGYKLVDSFSVGVRFTRPSGMQSLPAPREGGSVELLRELLNLKSNDDWIMLLGWLVMAFHPHGDHPILDVSGEQGTAKTTACRLARGMVDPNIADLRRPPREELDLVIAAKNSWIVGFDNFSSLPERLSDALCCLSTGSAFSTRTLFTTQDETLIAVKRPVVLNGIPDLATRGDLASRCVSLTLEAIPEEKRRTRAEVERRFLDVRPLVLGALLRAVSCALGRQEGIVLPRMTRMADMCVWVTAAEPALNMSPGTFLAAYERRLSESLDTVVESSPIGSALLALLSGLEDQWVGMPSALLAELEKHRGDGRRPKGWPDSAQKVSGEVRRIAPTLRQKGIEVVAPTKGSNPRLFRIGPLPAEDARGDPDPKRAGARAGAGHTSQEEPEKHDSRASAPSALPSQSPDEREGRDGAEAAAQDDEKLDFGWAD